MTDEQASKGKSRIASGLLIGFALVAVVLVTRERTLKAIGNWLDIGEQPQRTDYVMLLNGDIDTRPFEVADLFRRGKAGRVLITSIADDKRSLRPKTHEVTRLILTKCGVPDSKIDFVDSRCESTFDEAKTLEQFMVQHPESTFSVVTNTYHTRRSRWVFDNVLGPKMSQVSLVSAQTDAFNGGNWWKHEDGFVFYLAELLKSVFYFFRYGHGFAWISATFGVVGIGWYLRHRRLQVAVGS